MIDRSGSFVEHCGSDAAQLGHARTVAHIAHKVQPVPSESKK
ncbi:MAG: hypothetical protein ABI668_10850 [Sphingorhabdus sp.]